MWICTGENSRSDTKNRERRTVPMSLRFTECLRSYGRSVDWTLSGCFCTKACQSGTFSLQAYRNHEPAASAISLSVCTASSLETPSLRLVRPTP